jgi:hypothetical protein
MRVSLILFAAFITLLLHACSVRHKQRFERSNLPSLYNELHNFPRDQISMQQAIDKTITDKKWMDTSFEKDGFYINFINLQISGFEYYEYDRKSGECTFLFGGTSNGYQKRTGNIDKNTVTITDYYQDGKINQIKQFYSEDFPEELDIAVLQNGNLPHISFPIGKQLIFDKNGNLIEKIDCGKIFTFKLLDIKKLLKRKKLFIANIQIRGAIMPGNKGIWTIRYIDPIEGDCSMTLNSVTGAIIEEDHHLEKKPRL